MRNNILISLIMTILIASISYFLYVEYNKKIELNQFASEAKYRTYIMSLIVIFDKKDEPDRLKKYLKSTIFFDLRAINKYDDIKNSIDLKEYCEYIKDIQDEMYDFNATSKEIIKQICKDK